MAQGNQGSNKGGGGNQDNSSGRGFAGMDKDKQQEVASKGGKASHKNDNAGEADSGAANRNESETGSGAKNGGGRRSGSL